MPGAFTLMGAMMRRRAMLAVALAAVIAGAGGAIAISAETGEDNPVPPELVEEARGEPASAKFTEEQAAAISEIPIDERLDYAETPCESIDFGESGAQPRLCVQVEPSERVRAIAPEASASDMRNWDGENVVPSEIQQQECEFLLGHDFGADECAP